MYFKKNEEEEGLREGDREREGERGILLA